MNPLQKFLRQWEHTLKPATFSNSDQQLYLTDRFYFYIVEYAIKIQRGTFTWDKESCQPTLRE